MKTRREVMAAGMALGIPLSLFGNSDLGFFDTHWIANDGEKIVIDPEVIDFTQGLEASLTDAGVEVSISEGSTLSEWAEQDDGTLEGPSLRVTGGNGLLGLPTHHINYDAGLSNAEIARFTLSEGESLEVWRLETVFKGGGTSSDFSVDIYDDSKGSVIASTTSKVGGDDSPVGKSTGGATILVRVSNGTGSAQDACLSGITSIVHS